jgi:4'-phosphopantetheinyl transferase EntD
LTGGAAPALLLSVRDPDLPPVRGVVASLLPPAAAGVEAEPDDWDAALWPEEQPMVARAIERRRREVAAGRACARRALGRLGIAPVALPADSDRVPRWPAGVVGSITHTHGLCAAAVAWQRDLRGLGIDAERAIDTARGDVMRLVTTPSEAAWLAGLAGAEAALAAALVFSIKEALYKCQFPLTRQLLDFTDVELALADGVAAIGDGCTGALAAAFRPGTRAAELPPLSARYSFAGDAVVTAAFLPA